MIIEASSRDTFAVRAAFEARHGTAICIASESASTICLSIHYPDAAERQARPDRRGRQQAIHLVGDRAGGGAAGARVAMTYQGQRLEENVRELADGLTDPLVLPCDVTDDAQIAQVFDEVERSFGGLDFLVHGAAYATRDDLSNPFVQTTRDGFKMALDVSAYSLIALTRGALPLMETQGRRQHPDADLSRQRSRLSELQRDGRGESGARVDRAVSCRRSRSEEHPRERDFGRSDQDAGGGRDLRLLEHPAGLPRSRAAAADRRDRGGRRRCDLSAQRRRPLR